MTVELADLSPWLLLVAPLAVIAAYTVFGLSGFGATAISVPILAHFLPITYLVPLMALLDLATSAFLGSRNREHVSKPELKRLVPPLFVGFVLGVTVLVGVPDQYLRVALGIFATAIGVHGIFNPTLKRSVSTLWSIPAGVVGGAVATIFGAGGPIYATYLGARLQDKNEIRSTVAALISVSALTRAILYAVSGLLLHLSILVGGLVLAPFAWIGMRIGNRIHLGLSQEQMRRAVGGLLVATGVSLLARSLL